MKNKKRNKYNAKPVTIDGKIFASIAEGNRYKELKLLLRSGVISDLELQPRFQVSKGGAIDPTTGRKMPAARYTADFRYTENGKTIIEEVKSRGTARETSYRLRRKLFIEQYGNDVVFREMVK